MEYDAVLRPWRKIDLGSSSMLVGVIWDDKKGRFKDGASVRTSFVEEINLEEGWAKTKNTTYKLEK